MFRDHFSQQAAAYASHRPGYPAALFQHLASVCRRTERAWDTATGNGQAATGLAVQFATVVATDASRNQIANAKPHPGVRYMVAASEHSPLAPASIDLTTIAAALHTTPGTCRLIPGINPDSFIGSLTHAGNSTGKIKQKVGDSNKVKIDTGGTVSTQIN